MDVFILWHIREFPDGLHNLRFGGVFSSEKIAEQEIERLLALPGFEHDPNGFSIARHTLDTPVNLHGF
jgi:hypothetical protein